MKSPCLLPFIAPSRMPCYDTGRNGSRTRLLGSEWRAAGHVGKGTEEYADYAYNQYRELIDG